MELNYIILAHGKPLQLKRLVERLQFSNTNFYIHIDKETSIEQFQYALKGFNVKFLASKKRYSGTWGDIGIVKATIEALKLASESKSKKAYYFLLSGQDYLIKPVETIFELLKKDYGKDYITLYPLPHPNWEKGGMNRLDLYKLNKSKKRKHFLHLPSLFDWEFYSLKTLGKLNFLRKSGRHNEMKLIFNKRKFPDYLKPYGGSQWWCLTSNTINLLLDFLEKHPDYIDYHRYTLLPDEIFFHSILGSLKDSHSLKLDRSLTYVNWERASGPLPVTFKISDFDELKEASEKHLFARKFDSEKDQEIMDLIDKELL